MPIDAYLILLTFCAFILWILYLIIDFIRLDSNQFWDKWVKKTLWLWLPFYALYRVIKEGILKK